MENRLIHEPSPYLQQHAHNPVDWYPWGDEAFQKAAAESKPIFLSIGYSSCHWCHVMEREVFEQEKFAEILNAHFVSIKVDREERPDIDKFYQEVHHRLNRRPGGWPTSIFLTHERTPFFAATYIPPIRKHGMPAFDELLQHILQKYEQNYDELLQSSRDFLASLQQTPKHAGSHLVPKNYLPQVLEGAKEHADTVNGGFGRAPKFPHAPALELLTLACAIQPDSFTTDFLKKTLDAMIKGGLWDLVDGGFCRYSVDDEWLVPHFEKMTYDNGLLCRAYLLAAEVFNESRYREIALQIIAFMQEKMQENHLFYSASDADSEGEEGKYFVYEKNEIETLLNHNGYSDSDIESFLKTMGVSRIGNFERRNILRNESLEESPLITRFLGILKTDRHNRTYPFIDKKVITSWNAMMIDALFIAGRTDQTLLQTARSSLESLLAMMYRNGQLYHSGLIHQEPTVGAFLEDYAFLARATLEAYQSTLEESYLTLTRELAAQAIEHFHHERRWYFSRGEMETLADGQDMSYAASVGVMAQVLGVLGLLGDETMNTLAESTLQLYGREIEQLPVYFASLGLAVLQQQQAKIIKFPPSQSAEALRLMREGRIPHRLLLKPDSEIKEVMLCGSDRCFSASASITGLIDDGAKL